MTVRRYTEAPGVLLCTSTTRPLSPSPGDRIYETDTGYELTYQGATDTWTPPWRLPWGFITSASIVASSVATGGTTTVAGLSITFTSLANRRYRIEMFARNVTQVGAGTTDLLLARGVTVLADLLANQAAGTVPAGAIIATDVPGAGAVTYNFRTGTSGTTAQIIAGANDPAFIFAEDIGPSGAPS